MSINKEMEKATENWLLSKGVFVDCRKCLEKSEGCYKHCKFYQSYKKGKKDEQR